MRNKIKYILLLVFVLNCAFSQAAHLPKVALQSDTTAFIGDRLTLKFSLTDTDLKAVRFPSPFDNNLWPLEFYKESPTYDTVYDETAKTYTQSVSYNFSMYEEGLVQIPSFIFHIGQDTFLSSPYTIHFYAPEIDTTSAIKEIKDIWKVKRGDLVKEFFQRWKYIILIVLAVIALGIAAYYFYKKRKSDQPLFAPKKVMISPRELAIRQLKELKEKDLLQKNETKAYYTELVDILRGYLLNELEISAIEMTSEEILAALTSHPVTRNDQQLIDDIRMVLTNSDLVKFAKLKPSEDTHISSFEKVEFFIHHVESPKTEEDKTGRFMEDPQTLENTEVAPASSTGEETPQSSEEDSEEKESEEKDPKEN